MTTNILYEICRKPANDRKAFYEPFGTERFESYTDAVTKAYELGVYYKGFEFVVFPYLAGEN